MARLGNPSYSRRRSRLFLSLLAFDYDKYVNPIRNADKLTQPIDFRGMRYGKLMPTDLDGLYDLKGKAWVIFEVKSRGAPWPRGQLIAIERLASDLMEVKPTLAIRAVHDVAEGPINLAECEVHSYMERPLKAYGKPWRQVDPPAMTVRELVDTFVADIWKIALPE